VDTVTISPSVSCDRALAVAHADAVQAYHDLSPYRIEISLEEDGWHINYRIKFKRWAGGGPHYVIDATTGEIVHKKYYQ
jgi:uncharacterized membrane protein YkoI